MSKPKDVVKSEHNRLKRVLRDAGVSKERLDALQSIIENVSWMKIKLAEARQEMADARISIAYDNGGGQKGIRENPAFKGYEALWKSYMTGMSKILDALPTEFVEAEKMQEEQPKTVLAMIRDRHGRSA